MVLGIGATNKTKTSLVDNLIEGIQYFKLIMSRLLYINVHSREVIERKPEEFKIACLRDIGELFPCQAFCAGFGNKINVSLRFL